jgi:cytochrome c biogenesis protein CcmG/thiol:disulfide interchange protein DsbE
MSTNLNKPASESQSALQTILLIVAVAGIVFALSRFVLLRPNRTVGEKSPAVGQPAPDIHFAALTTPKGIRLAEAKGKVVLINFWGDWCGPCKVEFPHLVQLTNPYLTRDDFKMVSVNVPGGGGEQEELAADARKFLKAHAAKFEAYLDNDSAAFDALMKVAKEPQGGIPLTVVIDKTGVIAGLWIGYDSGDEEEVARVLAAALDANS